jgi:hypothetical protein
MEATLTGEVELGAMFTFNFNSVDALPTASFG